MGKRADATRGAPRGVVRFQGGVVEGVAHAERVLHTVERRCRIVRSRTAHAQDQLARAIRVLQPLDA